MTLTEIEAAAQKLSRSEQEALYRFLEEQRSSRESVPREARLIRRDGDLLLEAPAGAPPMSPEQVKILLENWP
jgi:uncharacterized membrane protein